MKQMLACIGAAGLMGLACSQPSPPQVPITPVLPTAQSTAPPRTGRLILTVTPVGPTPTPQTADAVAEAVRQANAAYSQGELDRAEALYRQALRVSERSSGSDASVRRLRAFSRFRLGLVALVRRDEPRARKVLQEDFRDEPDIAFRQLAFQLWDAYAMSGDVGAACTAVARLASDRGVSVALGPEENVGHEDICPLP